MLRRLRHRIIHVRRVVLTLALVASAAPVVAGPLAYCLNSGDAPRVVAAASHCESMAPAATKATAKTTVPAHLPTVDAAVGTGAGVVVVPTCVQTVVLFMQSGGLLPPPPGLLPSRDDAYGGARPERSSAGALADALVGRSVRLLI